MHFTCISILIMFHTIQSKDFIGVMGMEDDPNCTLIPHSSSLMEHVLHLPTSCVLLNACDCHRCFDPPDSLTPRELFTLIAVSSTSHRLLCFVSHFDVKLFTNTHTHTTAFTTLYLELNITSR
jgi:hypothetical protein